MWRHCNVFQNTCPTMCSWCSYCDYLCPECPKYSRRFCISYLLSWELIWKRVQLIATQKFITYFGLVALGANARGCRPTPSSRWRRTPSSLRLVTGKFTDAAHLLETHTSWGYCRWHEAHWGRVSSRDRQSFSRDSNLKSCVGTRVVCISLFPVSRVTVFRVEGAAAVDEGDACLIGQTVIDISRFHFCYCVSFVPWPILQDLKHNKPNQLLGNTEIKDAIRWSNNKLGA